MENFKETIKQLYMKKTYLDMYGGSVFMMLFILLIFFIIFSYFRVMNNIKPIKSNWSVQRCNPSVIPFAGLINKPKNTTLFSYTGENFNYCINNILASIANTFLEPIHYIINVFNTTIKGAIDAVQNIRKKFNKIIQNIESIDKEIMGRIMNFLIPVRKMLMKLRTIMQKTNAVLVTSLYNIITGYFSIKTFISAFVEIMIIGLGILSAIIIPLLFFIFTAPLAVPLLAIFSVVAGLVTIVIVGLKDVVDLNGNSIPSKPHCFHKDTKIRMRDGTYKNISEIKSGDLLKDDNKVTASFKVKRNHDMYNYKNVIVSGCHNVFYNGEWREVSSIPQSVKINDKKIIKDCDVLYCLNTSSKFIIINDVIFSDWDDIDNDEINKIYSGYNRKNKCNEKKYLSRPDFSSYFEKSLLGNTNILLKNKTLFGKVNIKPVQIKDIKIGDLLWDNNEKINEVIGIVTIYDKYHLLTSLGYFITDGNKIIKDYNYQLEKYL